MLIKSAPFTISIHALREEGDMPRRAFIVVFPHFYPRPPRGGRRAPANCFPPPTRFLSTPSARRATLDLFGGACHQGDFYPRPPRGGRLLNAAD